LFINIHNYLLKHAGVTGIEALMKSYQLYLEQIACMDAEAPVLSMTRAWTLVRFMQNNILTTACCIECGGRYVVHALDLNTGYVCGLCHMPSRAGKTRKGSRPSAHRTLSS
jgi:flagellar transcriptional activator FlhC